MPGGIGAGPIISAMRSRVLALCLAGTVGVGLARGQQFRFAYPVTDAGSVTAAMDVQYGSADGDTLAMDLYRPARAGSSRAPALVFFNRARGPNRHYYLYSGWAERAGSPRPRRTWGTRPLRATSGCC